MNKFPVTCAAVCLFLYAALSAGALDFGLALSQELKTSNETSGFAETGEPAFFYAPVLSPWVSGPLGRHFNLHLSGKTGFEYARGFDGDGAWREPAVLPELDRAELLWRVSPVLSFTLGRQRFRDPTGFTASGLFDGLNAAFSVRGTRFTAGAFYTGLLYKDTADITITSRDRAEHLKPFALDETYFASRRMLASVDWEHPGLTPRSSLALGLLGQFDLNEGEDRLHSQYLSARYGFRLPANVGVEGTGVFGVGETRSGEAGVYFAAGLEARWGPPGSLDDRLSLRGVYTSPAGGEGLWAFIPVNALPQGKVFTPALGGLALIKGAYTLRPHWAVSLTGEYACFIRTDTVSFQDDREPDKLKGEGYILGGELYGTAVVTPLPDLALTLGGGAFFPRLGNAYEPGSKVRWKAALGLIVSL